MQNQDDLRNELKEMEWGALRKRCREAGIGVLPEHTKDNLIAMFLERASQMTIFSSATEGSPIKPGYVRIKIMPGEATFTGVSENGDNRVTGQPEAAIEFCHNGRFYCIPRNRETDIPSYALSCLTNATSISMFRDEDTDLPILKLGPAYNYSIVGRGPPADLKDPGARTYESRDLRHRQDYLRRHGRFPTERDLAIEAGRQVPSSIYN